jgi:hypothetical protein
MEMNEGCDEINDKKREVEGGNEVLPRGEREGPEGTKLCRVILRLLLKLREFNYCG